MSIQIDLYISLNKYLKKFIEQFISGIVLGTWSVMNKTDTILTLWSDSLSPLSLKDNSLNRIAYSMHMLI